jgi:peptidoglycan/xylan/chitin deacetylase (PgdA/CDA1 family)
MIGVLAKNAEHPVVSEFFELFKTPWDFYRSDLLCDVLICSNTPPQNSSAKLILVYGAEQKDFDRENGIEMLSHRSSTVLSYNGDRVPIYDRCLTFRGSRVRTLVDEQTHEPAVLEMAWQGKRVVRVGFDLFQEIYHLLTRGQPLAHARIPALELHIAVLRDLIISHSIVLVEIPPVPADFNFIACLTHDVDHAGIRNHKCDHTIFGFLYRATIGSLINFCRGRRTVRQLAANWMAAFSLPFVHLGLAKDFWNQFDRYIDLEKDVKSTFFVIPKKGEAGETAVGPASRKRATRYDPAQIGDALHRLKSTGHEIALHGIEAWRDVTKGRAELEVIRGVSGDSQVGVRMHWLFFDDQSPAKLEKAGFSYDSTVGYNETVGYRAGTTQAFKPLAVEQMLELPMHIMDTALFFPDYMDLSPGQASDVVAGLIRNAARFGGVLTINWHDRSIAPERLWDDSYVKLLERLQSKEAWFPTASEAVSWFRKRRSAVVESVTSNEEAVRVKVKLKGGRDGLPGLRLRVHHAATQENNPPRQGETEGQFDEINFNQTEELEIALQRHAEVL